jgi:hypothetical protein
MLFFSRTHGKVNTLVKTRRKRAGTAGMMDADSGCYAVATILGASRSRRPTVWPDIPSLPEADVKNYLYNGCLHAKIMVLPIAPSVTWGTRPKSSRSRL